MKLNFMLFICLFGFCFQLLAKFEKPSVSLAVIAEVSKADFEEKILPILQKEFDDCSNCTYLNITPYSEKGEYDPSRLIPAIQAYAGKFQILFFNWNEKLNSQNKALSEFLQGLPVQEVTLVASAGQPKSDEPSSMLSKTIFGQIKNTIIIGEIGEKDRLIGQSYYGPEMLTALRPPKDLIGQGFSPLIFAARLAKNYHQRTGWLQYFQEKKSKTKKVWLEMGDLF